MMCDVVDVAGSSCVGKKKIETMNERGFPPPADGLLYKAPSGPDEKLSVLLRLVSFVRARIESVSHRMPLSFVLSAILSIAR